MRVVVHHGVALHVDDIKIPSTIVVYSIDDVKDYKILKTVFRNMIKYVRKIGYKDTLGVFDNLY